MASFDQGNGHSGWSSDVATVTLSLDGVVTGWSEGARRLLGHRAPEVVGRTATDLLLGEGAPGATGLSLTGSQEWRGTAALRHRDGHRVETALHAQPSLGGDGTPHSFVVALSPGPDRNLVEWAFDQASIALSTHSVTSGAWHRNATAETGERGVGGEGGARPVGGEGGVRLVEGEGEARPAVADGGARLVEGEGEARPAVADGGARLVEGEGEARPAVADGGVRPVEGEGEVRPAVADGGVRPLEGDVGVRPVGAEGGARPVGADGGVRPVDGEGGAPPAGAEGRARS